MPARAKKPTEDQRRVLRELRRAAVLREESERLYLQLFHQAMQKGAGITLIARAAKRTPQAANSMRVRLDIDPGPAAGVPITFNDAVRRARAAELERGHFH